MNKRKLKKAVRRLKYLLISPKLLPYTKNKISHYSNQRKQSLTVAHPSTIMIELTNRCNLHCTTCPREYQYGKEMDMGHIDFTLFKSIVEQSAPYLDSIGLTGLGEPLLYKDLKKSLEFIKSKDKGLITSISSNLMLPNTKEIISEIYPYLDTLQVSVDGLGEVYNTIRKKANFDIFDKNLRDVARLLRYTKTDILLNVVLVEENLSQVSDIIKYAANLNISYVNFTILNLAGIPDIDTKYYELYYSENFKSKIREAKETARQYPNVDVSFWDIETESGFKKCAAPWGHFYITFDGYSVPCCGKPFPKEKHFGNLKEKPLIDCLNSDDFMVFRKLWQQNISPAFCKDCNYIYSFEKK